MKSIKKEARSKRVSPFQMDSIIIVDICKYMAYFVEFLKRNKHLIYKSVVDGFISENFTTIRLDLEQMNSLETKLAFKTRVMMQWARQLGYIQQSSKSKYEITKKIKDPQPLILKLFNSGISSFTL